MNKNFSLKVAFCTVSMNRLHHLKLTLRQNIEDNRDYDNVEYIVLDYNSNDGMENWIKEEFEEEIETGLLVYLKTSDPKFFHRSHSRNIAFRVATGDILCNIDADNFTGKGFATFVNNQFKRNQNIYLIPDPNQCLRDCVGRLCIKREDFYKVNGYDEEMSDYGFEDNDLYNRLNLLGIRKKAIKNKAYLTAITHDNNERYKCESMFLSIKRIFLNYISPERTEILILKSDFGFKTGNLVTDHENEGPVHLPHIEEKKWIIGKWMEIDGQIYLIYKDGKKRLARLLRDNESDYSYLNIDEKIYFEINDVQFFNWLLLKLPLITNNQILRNNIKNGSFKVNKKSFGKSKLSKNFKEVIELA